MEETRKFKQESIAAAVPIASSAHVSQIYLRCLGFIIMLTPPSPQYFDLKLDSFGPYSFNYSRNGR